MSRSLDREEEQHAGSSMLDGLSRSGAEKRVRVDAIPQPPKWAGHNESERILWKEREYRIRPSQWELLETLGTFRVVQEKDLVSGVFRHDSSVAAADVRSLRQQGLIRSITFQRLGDKPTKVHTLSGPGHQLLSELRNAPQLYYFGFVKPAEVAHDSLLYRAFLRERREIEASGFSVKRIVLDVELKRSHFARVNKPGGKESYRRLQEESARELHLPVVDGHVVFPDFRIECEDERGDLARVDVEVATENYRGSHLAAKAQAGFRVYGSFSAGGGAQVQSGARLKGQAFPQETRMVLPL